MSYVVSVTVTSFFVGLVTGLGLHLLNSVVFSEPTPNVSAPSTSTPSVLNNAATKRTVIVITGLVISAALLPVRDTVKRRANELLEETVGKISIPPEAEDKYVCHIPFDLKGEEAVRKSASEEFCDDCRRRDAIIRGFAYNEKLIESIAAFATEETLKNPRGINVWVTGEKYSEEQKDRLFNDIYIYLRAWLVMSATHKCEMPLDDFITQNFPSPQKPDKKFYVTALNLVKDQLAVKDGMSDKNEDIFNSMNHYINDERLTCDVMNLLSDYLVKLISNLKKEQ